MRRDGKWLFLPIVATLVALGRAREEILVRNDESGKVDGLVDYRLPKTIMPNHYVIMLLLPADANSTIFDGIIKIDARVAASTDTIVFHAGSISIATVGVFSDSKSLNITNWTQDGVTEKTTVKLAKELSKDVSITLAITYKGTLRDNMIGLYRSSYINDNGETRWVAATQFQAVHARHAFPCFDEPSFKANFTVRILRPQGLRCLGNMPLIGSKPTRDGRIWDIFATSVRMSTYLVAFVVSDFSSLVDEKNNFTVWARPNAIDQAEYALQVGPRSLEILSELFDEDYKLGKMDMVALPDFAAGAMENWGLITYRETRMLYDANESSAWSQQDVASVIVHECVHMWFGNLVTPMWWGYLWLSEGFARYYQYMATAKLEPSWRMDQQFVVEQLQTVYAVDALDSSSPLSRNVSSQDEIGTTGDTITYSKGASVIRMMELTFGSGVFNSALREYLQIHKYRSTIPDDLWSVLQHQVDLSYLGLGAASVKTIMDTWTEQSGFPVLSVKIANGSATLSQERFLLRNPDSLSMNSTWWIPVSWATRKNSDFLTTSPKYWLGTESAEVEVNVGEDEWIVFNVQEAGFYRVNYDSDSWYRIIDLLMSERFQDIHEVNRAAIVDDLLNLARAGYLDYDTALTGLNYIKRETNYLPFKAAFAGLDYLNKRFAGQESYHYVSNYSLSVIKYIYKDVGYEDRDTDDRLTILLRKELNTWACSFDEAKCVDRSLVHFNKWRFESKPVPKNQRSVAYCTAVRHGGQEDWNFLWKKYLESNCASEQSVILKALGCSRDTKILEKYLLSALKPFDESRIRKQDSTAVFSAVYGSSVLGAEYILEFVAKHHEAMAEFYGGYHTVASVLSGASQRFSTDEHIEKFAALIDKFSVGFETMSKSLESSLELAKYERRWFKNNERAIIAWMMKNNKGEPTTPSNGYRLPTSIVPKSYVVKLTPYIEPGNFTFDGVVRITASVVESTNQIVLHISELHMIGVKLMANGKPLAINKTEENPQYDFYTITLGTHLMINTTLDMELFYSGKLNTDMRGFYRSSYVDDAGDTKWLAATHLEPVGARKVFPCFDEPALKATFVISVNRPVKYKAISNTRLITSEPVAGDRVWDTFEKTPVMSTYLVALIVSDFESLKDEENSCATWSRPNAINQTKYALSVMGPLVKFFVKTVDHPYQLPKLDMVALPDFVSGAMENWGLLTYKESNMLYDENHSPITSKQSIANVISHEISHQWFGDQVTPSWWKYVWLSEGFARYFQYHGTSQVETEWGLESQFVVEQLHSAFGTDALDSIHPMTHDVESPSEISAIFDAISYAKAASVLRMVEKTFGSNLFYKALHEYLKARNRTNATPDHLFEAFQDAIDTSGTKLKASVKTIMDTWTTQGGYPVVHVEISDRAARLRQERFLLRNHNDTAIDRLWWIPITWASRSKPAFNNTLASDWLSSANGTLQLGVREEWVIFNVQQTGYYRVNYDPASWTRLINILKSNESDIIHEVNRASLIDDLLNLGRSGHVDYATVLSATQYLINETNYIPWRAAFNGLAYLNQRFAGQEIYDLYRTHILTILKPAYEKLVSLNEYPDRSHYDKLLTRYVVNWACEFDLEDCVARSLRYFAEWKSKAATNPVPVDLRNTVYRTAIKHGFWNDASFLWEQYKSARVTTEKDVILSALGCSKDTDFLERLLLRAITDGSEIRHQDSLNVFSSVYNCGLFGAEYTLKFVEKHYKEMYDYYGDYSNVASILSAVSSRFSTKELVLKFQRFVETQKSNLTLIESSLQKSLTDAHEELAWYDTNKPRIFEWLDTTYSSEDYRLPKKIRPTTYDISLTPHLEEGDFTFDGEVKVEMEVRENTSSIVLLANELKIKQIVVTALSEPLKVSGYNINETTHRFTIYLSTTVGAGSKISAKITYTGFLNDKMKGFYRSSYVDKNGKTRWLASTQFEPVYARQAFPCFDEPAFKAKFIIHIERPSAYRTLSNMPWNGSFPSEKPRWAWDSYKESKLMSSYLVAFVVSDFEPIQNFHENFTVWGRPEVIQHGDYALKVGQEVMKFLETFTGIEYPIGKMDLVAVPDFASGAMENWGLITFREYGLFSHRNVTSALYKRYLNTVVAHEHVHMWFGNLVTCDWWDYVWLHEGFAEYLQWIASDSTEPEWNLLQQFVVYEMQAAMEIDASPNTHPMNNNVSKPLDIANTFDKIAYAKSASVIRMMHHAFGPKVFQSGLRTYLKISKYDNANPDDLWNAVQMHKYQENSTVTITASVKTLMDTWANQAGYPVVNATWTANELTLKQQRFLISKPKEKIDKIFWIPITMTTRNESNFTRTLPAFWFGTKFRNRSLILKEDEWFILNIQETGYYRVNYDTDSWKRLIAALHRESFDGIHEINRAQIIDDLLNLARADYVDYDTALSATKYLSREENHLPWRAFFNGVAFLNDRFDGHKIGEDLADYVLGLMQRIYEKVGFVDERDDEDQLGQLNRQLMLSWACKFGHSSCLETAKRNFQEWRKDEQKWISPNARPAVYCTSLREGTHEDWAFLWSQYEKTNFASEKVVILSALGCTRNTTTLNNYMKRALSADGAIRNQDVASVFSSVYNSGRFGVDTALDFLINNYDDLYECYGSWSDVAGLFSNVAGKISTQEQIAKLESFAGNATTDIPEMSKSLRSSVEAAKENQQWVISHSEGIHVWLAKSTTEAPKTETDGGGSSEPNASGIARCSMYLVIAASYPILAFLASVTIITG